jgi:hypothetical protein
MATNTRDGLIEYCLRALGAPVLQINVDEDQAEDRVDEALEYYKIYHTDGAEQALLKQQIRASRVTLVEPVARSFGFNTSLSVNGNTVTEDTVNVVEELGFVYDNDNVLTAVNCKELNVGDIISDGITTATVASVEVLEYDNRYIDIPDYVYGVTRLINLSGNSNRGMFSIEYQVRLNDIYSMRSTGTVASYSLAKQHLAFLDHQLNGQIITRFNRNTGKLYIDYDWRNFMYGEYVLIECYRALNPSQFMRIWNDRWLKKYTTALIKRQWASNMKKYSNVQMLGGTTFDAQIMFDEANTEIQDLEEELRTESAPLSFFMG